MSAVEDQIAQLSQKLNSKMLVRKELRKLPEMLQENEVIVNLVQGNYEGHQGLIVVTEDRVMFLDEGVVRSRREDFPYRSISSIQTAKALMFGKVTIFASGNKAVLDQIAPKAQADVIADYVRQRIAGGSPTPAAVAAAPPASEDDVYEKLRKLGELRDGGVLTPEEFDAKKAQLLDQI